MATVLSMLNLVPGSMGGSETYAREILREFASMNLDVTTLVSPLARGFSGPVREEVAPEYHTGASRSARVKGLALGTLRRRSLSRRTGHANVVHYPFTVAIPPPTLGQRSVVTLMDVQHHDLPEMFSWSERAYRHFAYDGAARNADAVIALSQFAKDRMVHHLGLDPVKVHVAYLGVRPEEYAPPVGGRESFVLYPAKAWPHKNHATLFEAFRILRQRHPTLRLVLTGAVPSDLPPLGHGVEAHGLVQRRDLVALYGKAAALVFPSRYEGFGLPVIEAMSSGCPVAAADAGALPEVAGDAAVLFNPLDAEAIANSVEAALDRRAELQVRGLERAARYSWFACATVHTHAYASGSNPGKTLS